MIDVQFKDFPKELKRLVSFENPMLAYVVAPTDGDTFTAFVRLPFKDTYTVRLRLKDVDAPSDKTPEGKVAAEYLNSLLPSGTPIVITPYKTTFDRYEAKVQFLKGNEIVDLGAELLASHHAEAWTKQRK